MKTNTKNRLFEVMSRLDETFKPKLNEGLFTPNLNKLINDVKHPYIWNTLPELKTGLMELVKKYGYTADYAAINNITNDKISNGLRNYQIPLSTNNELNNKNLIIDIVILANRGKMVYGIKDSYKYPYIYRVDIKGIQ